MLYIYMFYIYCNSLISVFSQVALPTCHLRIPSAVLSALSCEVIKELVLHEALVDRGEFQGILWRSSQVESFQCRCQCLCLPSDSTENTLLQSSIPIHFRHLFINDLFNQ